MNQLKNFQIDSGMSQVEKTHGQEELTVGTLNFC